MNPNPNDAISLEKNHYLIVPNDPIQRDFCEKVERASRNSILENYKVRLNASYGTTFACAYLEALIRTLGRIMVEQPKDAVLNFLDMIILSCDNREGEMGDKDGNINITFAPGPVVEQIMARDYCPVISPEIWQGTIINEVEKCASTILSTKHKAVSDQLWRWTVIAYTYFEFVFRTLKLMAKEGAAEGKNSVSINFLEMMEIHCNVEQVQHPDNPELVSEEYRVKIRPGFQAKLLIKNDGATEVD